MDFSRSQKLHDSVDWESKQKDKGGHASSIFIDVFSFLLFLFFIQQITFLVESIYMLNLLNTKMDIRATGILLLALPGLLIFIKHRKSAYYITVSTLLFCMLLSPVLPTALRIFSSGIGAGLFLLFLGLQLSDHNIRRVNWGQNAALATLMSIVFRLAGHTLDISITGNTKYIGWVLVLIAAILFYKVFKTYPTQEETVGETNKDKYVKTPWLMPWVSIRGLAGAFIFIYFVFSSPAVLARWTEGNYYNIQIVVSIFILGVVFFSFRKIVSLKRIRLVLAIWNISFLFSFVLNILLHRIQFPSLQELAPVIVAATTTFNVAISYLMLILSPVIFINIAWFANNVQPVNPRKLALPFIRAVALIIVCTFMLIFTNAWGYVGWISKIFRNQFHIPFIIAGIYLVLPFVFSKGIFNTNELRFSSERINRILAGILVIACCGFVILGNKKQLKLTDGNSNELTLMTYNIQQGVDFFGNKNFEGQLTMIQEIDPNIICLQESDASRISGGNSDVVRYFAENLGFYSYYGPKTITGTYGTAILSRFPLDSCRTIFTYSSKDEIGTSMSEISISGKRVIIINSHPAGNEKAREEHINMVVDEASNYDHVIAMGDYNFTQESPYYKIISNALFDAWLSLYPDAIGPAQKDKVDRSFTGRSSSNGQFLDNGQQDMKQRIDHIFLSDGFKVLEAHYLPAPESQTDHPVHWAVVSLD